MPNLTNDAYRDAIGLLALKLEQAYKELVEAVPLPLDGTATTRALLLRMSAFSRWQKCTKTLLGKRVASVGADFFVETVLFYVKAFDQSRSLGLSIASELAIERKRGALRPDISIWRGTNLIGVIECKMQLGWDRDNWERHFTERQHAVKKHILVLECSSWCFTGRTGQVLGKVRSLALNTICCLK